MANTSGEHVGVRNLLDAEHYEVFEYSLKRLLATDIALATMAELVDGLPRRETLRGVRAGPNHFGPGNPIMDHVQLCDGAMAKASEFCSKLEVSTLLFPRKAVEALQGAAMPSDQLDRSILELLAISVHSVAVQLYSLPHCHSQEEIDEAAAFQLPTETEEIWPGRWYTWPTLPAHPNLFFHPRYRDYDQYPHGKADMAGYWAEDQIFGGVILLDRGVSGDERNDIYLHSGRLHWTNRVWCPLETQMDAMMGYLFGEWDDAPFPLYADKTVLKRHDSWDAMALHHIYRDPWERKIPAEKDYEKIRLNTFDYPELEEQMRQLTQSSPGRDIPLKPFLDDLKNAPLYKYGEEMEAVMKEACNSIRERNAQANKTSDGTEMGGEPAAQEECIDDEAQREKPAAQKEEGIDDEESREEPAAQKEEECIDDEASSQVAAAPLEGAK